MDEEEDDFYDPTDSTPAAPPNGTAAAAAKTANANEGEDGGSDKDDKMDESLEEGEEGEDEDEDGSESDIDIITERKDGRPPEPVSHTRHTALKSDTSPSTATELPVRSQQTSSAAATAIAAAPATTASKAQPDGSTTQAAPQRLGSSFPEVRTSTIDVNADPIYEPLGKPISKVHIESDLAEHEKPWRLPGADQSDYFNYGFDEYTWTSYLLKRGDIANEISELKAENANFEALFGMPGMGAAMPGMPGLPGAAGSDPSAAAGPGQGGNAGGNAGAAQGAGMPAGMPAMMPEEMMNAMATHMMSQGITDPSQLDFGTFMAQMQQMQGGGMGVGVPQGPGGQQGGGQGGYGGGGAGGGGGGGGNFGKGRGGRRW